MPAFDQEHQYTLPSGLTVCVRQLDITDARATQEVMTAGWETAYVEPGLMTRENRREFTNPDDKERVAFIAGRINEARTKLESGDMTGALFLGAFTVGDQAEQLGMIKYSTVPGKHVFSGLKLPEGYVDEVDAKATRQGVGRVMFAVALQHGTEIGHDVFGLAVVLRNPKARAFYAKHLAMVEQGDAEIVPGMPESMRRIEMRGLVRKSLNNLRSLNPWLKHAGSST